MRMRGGGRRLDGRSPAGVAAVLTAVLVTVLITGAVSACGTRADQVRLPAKPPHDRVAGTAARQLTARQLVISAYEGYWQATSAALASRSPARARSILVQYVPGSAIPALVKGLKMIWRRGETGYGGPVFHIMNVTFDGRSAAAVHDCIDLSHAGFQNVRTGQIVGGIGLAHDYLITTLVRTGGRWLVTGAIPVVRPC
jgi:hypothetical protein